MINNRSMKILNILFLLNVYLTWDIKKCIIFSLMDIHGII